MWVERYNKLINNNSIIQNIYFKSKVDWYITFKFVMIYLCPWSLVQELYIKYGCGMRVYMQDIVG